MKNSIIPCLDIKDKRVVKGINFVDIKDAGDIKENASYYQAQGADEIVLLNIVSSADGVNDIAEILKDIKKDIHIPISVGGGINTVELAEIVLKAGADKVSVNSAAVKNPQLIKELSTKYGKNKVISAIDAKKVGENYHVFIGGGQIDSGIDVFDWTKKVCDLGAGSILLTSIDFDGTKQGYDIELTKKVAECATVPVIASGGAGKKEHFLDAFAKAKAKGALAASLFHFKEIEVAPLKEYLRENGVKI